MEGETRRKYIKARKGIRSFDDLYEFLLSQFDVTTSSTSLAETQQPLNNNSANELSLSSNTTEDNQREKSTDISNSIKFDRRLPTRQSNAESILGATNTFGEIPDIMSEIDLANNSSITIKQTVNDLRSAIVGDLIKNPKIFRGEKDDVKKWIDEIEHLLDVAHIPDSNRLELTSYLLRGDALEWYKNNKSILSTWKIFTHEIKRAFTSLFREELAFKRLETYCQGENQSVRNFFNEILKLCAEADSTMSEATKLKTLLNKTKPSIQFEVRKKKPTSTAEFLEYAKEVEELLQLSNLTIENNNKDISLTYINQGVPPTISTPTSTNTNPMNNSWSNYSQQYFRNFNHNYRTYNNRNYQGNQWPSTNKPNPLHPTQYFQGRSGNSNQRFQSNRYNSSSNINNHQNRNISRQYQNNSSKVYKQQPATANTVAPSQSSHTSDLQDEPFSSVTDIQGNKSEHDHSLCPNF